MVSGVCGLCLYIPLTPIPQFRCKDNKIFYNSTKISKKTDEVLLFFPIFLLLLFPQITSRTVGVEHYRSNQTH